MRIVVTLASLMLIALFCVMGAAELSFRRGVAEKNVEAIRYAQRLNPWVSEYVYQEYRLTKDIGAIQRAMRLEPTDPSYHMYYGLALLRLDTRTRASDTEALDEICKAAELKPYSQTYREACEKYQKLLRPALQSKK